MPPDVIVVNNGFGSGVWGNSFIEIGSEYFRISSDRVCGDSSVVKQHIGFVIVKCLVSDDMGNGDFSSPKLKLYGAFEGSMKPWWNAMRYYLKY